ncbi:MAG: translation initiation factor IF-2 [Verrucomicrobiota bacterium]|nr:translation initiation factor IF-2 [Verrucomicrobiota bacterium]
MSVRVYQLSKEIGMENSQLMEILKTRGHDIKSASSTVDNISAASLREEFGVKAVSDTTEAPAVREQPSVAVPDAIESTPATIVELPTESAPPAPTAPAITEAVTVVVPEEAPAPVVPAPVVPTPAVPVVSAPQPTTAPVAVPPSAKPSSGPAPLSPPSVPRNAPPPISLPRGPLQGTPQPQQGRGPGVSAAPFKPTIPVGAIVRSKDEIDKERQDRIDSQRKNALVAPPPQVVKPQAQPQQRPGAPNRTGAAPISAPQGYRPPQQPSPQQSRSQPGQSRQGQPMGPNQGVPPVQMPRQEAKAAPIVPPPVVLPPAPARQSPPPPPPPAPAQPASPPAIVGQPRSQTSQPPALPGAPEPVLAKPATKDAVVVQIKPPIVVRDFAVILGLRPFKLISELMEMGIFASMNQVIEPEVAAKIAVKHNFQIEIKHRGESQQQVQKAKEVPKVDESLLLEPRPPVVCILGHVDHGKTTLLDTIRKANVAASEAGGITQHIGAYQIEHNGKKITFIDTPGHAAFANMRARGANTTDIAVLVVAADDGFMRQTDEALNHIRNAKVPIVVAINKMDARGANIDRVKQQCQERNLMPEDWGGDTLVVPVSALKGTGVPDLLEAILLQTELMENVKANPKGIAEGIIIEAQKELGRGPTASVIIQKGTLKPGDSIVCGPFYCKVRQILDDLGKPVKAAPPSMPVKLVGWSETPESGLRFTVVKNEKEAKNIAEENELELKRTAAANKPRDRATNVEELLAAIAQTKSKVFKVLVKADVYGTAEALALSLELIKSEKITIEVVDIGVGAITKNDILMAHASGSSLVAFDVGLDTGVGPIAKHHNVVVYSHNIIYELIDIVKSAMADQLDPELREQKLGAAEVRAVFPISKGMAGGCMITEGRVNRDAKARLLRKGKVEFEGSVSTLRRFKDDANEVRSGFECGMRLGNYDGYQVGDIIEVYEIIKIKASL